MNKRWRKIALVGASLLTALSLTGCGNNNNGQAEKTSDGKTVLTFWTFIPLQAKYWKTAAVEWNKVHPKQQIKLKTTVLPFGQQYEKLTTALQGGTGAPDLVDVEIGQAATQLKAKNPPYLSLNKELAPYKDELIQSRLNNYKKDGKYYGLDYHVGTYVTYYNKSILDKAGINYKNIKTWKQYTAAGKVVKKKTGAWMTVASPNAYAQWFAQTSQQHVDWMKNDMPNVNTPQAIKALQMEQDWIYKDGIARKAPGGNIDNDQCFAQLNKEKITSVTMPAWYMSRMIENMPKLKHKMVLAPMPVFNKGDRTSADGGGTATMVTNQTPKSAQKLAKEFAVFGKANKKMATKQWTMLGFDPIRKDVWKSSELRSDNLYTRYFGKDIFNVLIKLQDQTGHLTVTDKNSPTVIDYLLKYTLPSVIGKGTPSAKAGLDKAQSALTKQIKAGQN